MTRNVFGNKIISQYSREEFIRLLNENGIDIDEKYLVN